jgi:hypothetical protein
VEHAGHAFERLLRPYSATSKTEADASARAAKLQLLGGGAIDDAKALFSEAVSRAVAADAAVKSVARAAFQKVAKALHADRQRAGGGGRARGAAANPVPPSSLEPFNPAPNPITLDP